MTGESPERHICSKNLILVKKFYERVPAEYKHSIILKTVIVVFHAACFQH